MSMIPSKLVPTPRRWFVAPVVAGLLLGLAAEARACTTFCFRGSLLFGKNYDWSVGEGLLLVNKRGMRKEAMTEDRPAQWTSRFGSVTFNQYGREFPNGGMNERGLVVELMWLDETEYPAPDARHGLPNLQWIQYQLDQAATVDEVVASDQLVRITRGAASIHFLVADVSGEVAAIEFLAGHMVVHRGDDLPFRALTNDTYATSVEYAQRRAGSSHSSLDRFARAARATADRSATVDEAFTLLRNVAQDDYTRWSIVYDIGGRRVHFRTREQTQVRFLDFDDLSFGCETPVLMLSLDDRHRGDLAKVLRPYTYEANQALVRAAFTQTEFLRGTTDGELVQHARYPERTTCTR